jgi:hypothetical protein
MNWGASYGEVLDELLLNPSDFHIFMIAIPSFHKGK